jgi:hypothetical protein
MFTTIFNLIFGKQNAEITTITSYDNNELVLQDTSYEVDTGKLYKVTISGVQKVENISVKNVILIGYEIVQNNLVITIMPYFFEHKNANIFKNANSKNVKLNVNDKLFELTFNNANTSEQEYTSIAKKLYYLQINIESLKLQLHDQDNKECIEEINKRLQHFETSFKNTSFFPVVIPEFIEENEESAI